ncbi:transcription termination/antitermination protein NusA, partial [candidate division WWE3 bacterium]|nr:transcription termination/antitermination protein NusA [candidate division WWE3 bacterium]
MIRSEFMAAINAVASDRGIEPEEVLETLRHALLAAYRKDYGDPEGIEAHIDPDNGEISLVLDGEDVTPAGFGRIAAQTAKQVILQRVREAEKDAILSDYRDKIDTVVSGMLQRKEGRHWMVDIGRTIALMPIEEQVRNEDYHQNMRLKVVVEDIRPFRGREVVVVSRVSDELVRGLFEMEVPEVSSGAVEIKAIAREVGQRSKVAVTTNQEGVDPIGSAVGQRGVRVQAITDELMGEKIDIILWNPDVEKFIVAALSPAKVIGIKANTERQEAVVVVPEDQL